MTRSPERGRTGSPTTCAEIGRVSPSWLPAANDEQWDKVLEAETEEALSRVGRDVGTPIITFGGERGPSFFGPVISRIPRGEEAVQLWDAVELVATTPGMAELKRSLREASPDQLTDRRRPGPASRQTRCRRSGRPSTCAGRGATSRSCSSALVAVHAATVAREHP